MICNICKRAVVTTQDYQYEVDGIILCRDCFRMLLQAGHLSDYYGDDNYHFIEDNYQAIIDLL